MMDKIVYTPGKDICPLCDTFVYHNKGCVVGALLRENNQLRADNERTHRLWSEDRAAVKDWAAASDAIGELYEILGVTKDSAGFEDGFTKIVAATKEQASRVSWLECQKKALQQVLSASEVELEREGMRLAACSTAALQNTESTLAERIRADNPYWSAAYLDVCRAVDREMKYREQNAVKDVRIRELAEEQATQRSIDKYMAKRYDEITSVAEKHWQSYWEELGKRKEAEARRAFYEKVVVEAKMAVIGYPRYEMRNLRAALEALPKEAKQ